MKTIWKFPLNWAATQAVQMPAGAVVLTAQFKDDRFNLWAICDPMAALEFRTFQIIGTGHTLPDDVALQYVASVQEPSGDIGHIFERTGKLADRPLSGWRSLCKGCCDNRSLDWAAATVGNISAPCEGCGKTTALRMVNVINLT